MSSVSSWADLTDELLVVIKNHLECRSDIRLFRAVCSSWLSSTPPLFKLDQFKSEVHLRNNFSLEECLVTHKTIFCLEPLIHTSSSPSCWLFGVENSGGKLYFVNPFTGMIIQPGPPALPEVLDLFNYFKISKLQGFNNIQSLRMYTDGLEQWETRKALFLSPPHYEEAILDVCKHSFSSRWALYKLKNGQWGEVEEINVSFMVQDTVLYKGIIWIVDGDGCTLVIDSTFNPIERAEHLFPVEMNCFAYLVVSSSGLFLVEKQDSWTLQNHHKREYGMSISWWIYRLQKQLLWIKVYKLKEEEKRWAEVTHLDDQIMFVCCGDYGVSPSSFSVASSQVPGCKGNCIVFTFNNKRDSLRGSNENPENAGVFDMETGKLQLLQRCPGYATLFSPPPTWLKFKNAC